jgi:hypothetical protein
VDSRLNLGMAGAEGMVFIFRLDGEQLESHRVSSEVCCFCD